MGRAVGGKPEFSQLKWVPRGQKPYINQTIKNSWTKTMLPVQIGLVLEYKIIILLNIMLLLYQYFMHCAKTTVVIALLEHHLLLNNY